MTGVAEERGGERGRWGSKRERGGGAKRELVLRLTEDGGFKGVCACVWGQVCK